ncbi:hypothetical protein [Dokdonella sp.]|nr:hypothetical protein [Dokdonella sp.]
MRSPALVVLAAAALGGCIGSPCDIATVLERGRSATTQTATVVAPRA